MENVNLFRCCFELNLTLHVSDGSEGAGVGVGVGRRGLAEELASVEIQKLFLRS